MPLLELYTLLLGTIFAYCHEPSYVLFGIVLISLSLLSMSMMFGENGGKEFINREIKMAKWYTIIILLTIFFIYIVGVFNLMFLSALTRSLMLISIGVLWAGLAIIEVSMVIKLFQAGFRPKPSKRFFDAILYIVVLGLIFERFEISWTVIALLTTISMVAIIYFIVMLWKYGKMANILVEPLDLYAPASGFVFFSVFIGIVLISYGHSENVFRGFIALSFIILAAVFWYTAMNMEKTIRI
jgi:hypothetical protein